MIFNVTKAKIKNIFYALIINFILIFSKCHRVIVCSTQKQSNMKNAWIRLVMSRVVREISENINTFWYYDVSNLI